MPATKPSAGFSPKWSAPKIWGHMPTRMKVLYITTLHRTGGWLAEAFAADCAAEMWLKEAVGVTAGLAHLRDEVFDAVLISHEPGVLDALELVEGLRAGGNEEPMIVLGTQPSAETAALCYEVGADAYCCVAARCCGRSPARLSATNWSASIVAWCKWSNSGWPTNTRKQSVCWPSNGR
jgi:hypothetical protein